MVHSYYLIPLLVPLLFLKGNFAQSFLEPVERWTGRIAARPWCAVVFVGLTSLIVCAGVTLTAGVPVPKIGDEFGYRLQGDTFAHWRVTNPTPPLWEHFETIHEIMRPTYTAKYPPAQGVALAMGELLGQPIIGAWATTALACSAIVWMLMAWVPARWAIAGGLIAAFHPQVIEWSQDYWGGSIAMGGGALLIGAASRIARSLRVRDAILLGLALAILVNSRPFEGFVLSVLVLAALALVLIKKQSAPLPAILLHLFLPLLVVAALTSVQIGYYNWRVTGKPMLMPYVVYDQTYGIAPAFIFEKPMKEPEFRNPQIREFQEQWFQTFASQRRSPVALLRATMAKLFELARGFLWSGLIVVALLGLPGALARNHSLWIPFGVGILFIATLLLETWMLPHYAAAATGLLLILVTQSLARLHVWHWGARPAGRNLVRGLAILCLISFFQLGLKMRSADRTGWNYRRQAILNRLRQDTGRTIVIVRYRPDHNPNREWVYNDADIEHSKVIFARDMGPVENKEIIDFMHDRRPLILDADEPDPEPRPYTGS